VIHESCHKNVILISDNIDDLIIRVWGIIHGIIMLLMLKKLFEDENIYKWKHHQLLNFKLMIPFDLIIIFFFFDLIISHNFFFTRL
jgi:hypothetical protein